jgi:hypothetical protein
MGTGESKKPVAIHLAEHWRPRPWLIPREFPPMGMVSGSIVLWERRSTESRAVKVRWGVGGEEAREAAGEWRELAFMFVSGGCQVVVVFCMCDVCWSWKEGAKCCRVYRCESCCG